MADEKSDVLYRMQRKFCAQRQIQLDERTKTASDNCEKCRRCFKKEKKMPLFRRKIERGHEKETMRAAEKMRRTAAWKSTAKDNFSGGKKSF